VPKRSERELYDHAFDVNPYEGLSLDEMYDSIQWGKNPEHIYPIDAPEPLASLGTLALLKTKSAYGTMKYKEKNAPFLAVGQDTNCLYIVPRNKDGSPQDIPEFDPEIWEAIGEVKATHYYSDKGNEEGYYYHDHESPYPVLFVHESTGIGMLVPVDMDGKPSYAVIKEGIIG